MNKVSGWSPLSTMSDLEKALDCSHQVLFHIVQAGWERLELYHPLDLHCMDVNASSMAAQILDEACLRVSFVSMRSYIYKTIVSLLGLHTFNRSPDVMHTQP